MREVTLGQLEWARGFLASKRKRIDDGLYQEALEIGEMAILRLVKQIRSQNSEVIRLEELE